jgi:hypothetical protein
MCCSSKLVASLVAWNTHMYKCIRFNFSAASSRDRRKAQGRSARDPRNGGAGPQLRRFAQEKLRRISVGMPRWIALNYSGVTIPEGVRSHEANLQEIQPERWMRGRAPKTTMYPLLQKPTPPVDNPRFSDYSAITWESIL